jgi:hypothetical protein
MTDTIGGASPAGMPRGTVIGGAAPAGMNRDAVPEPAEERNWDPYCSAGSAAMQRENRAVGESIRSLDLRRGTMSDQAYHEAREPLLQRRSQLDQEWQRLKDECATHRLDIGRIEGDQPPATMPPRTPEEAAADERDRAVSRLAAERVEAAVADREAWERDKPLEVSIPSEILIGTVSAGISAGISLASGAAGRVAAGGTGAWTSELGGQVADDCVACSQAALRTLAETLPPGAPQPATVDATVGLPWGPLAPPQHVVLRYPDGTTIDRTILHNLESAAHAAGVPFPQELEAYRAADTFSPELHRQLMDYYMSFWNARFPPP